MDTEQRQAEFARRVTAKAGWPAGDERLEAAFRAVRRRQFLPPGVPDALLYADTTIGLGPLGINNGQPSLHAACLAALAPRAGESVLHVGAGTGYYSAILAQLVEEAGRVEAYEVEPELARQAVRNLEAWPHVAVHAHSGASPPLPSSDMIYVNCGASGPRAAWLEALRPGGRLLFPLTGVEGTGAMLLVRRPAAEAEAWPARFSLPVLFVDCSDAREPSEVQEVTQALARSDAARVLALHRSAASPGSGRVWCAGRDWWLEQSG